MPSEIHAAALRHMRAAQAVGWHTQAMICDAAVSALIAEGYIGGAAQNVSDPEAFITKSIAPIEHTARAVHKELHQTSH
jgi:hypothetical protein